jgi:hypothetical protein
VLAQRVHQVGAYGNLSAAVSALRRPIRPRTSARRTFTCGAAYSRRHLRFGRRQHCAFVASFDPTAATLVWPR